MRVIYQGPSPEVVVIIEGGGIHAPRGEAIDVPDDLGESLLEQDTFKKAPTKKTDKADPAASVSAAVPQEDEV